MSKLISISKAENCPCFGRLLRSDNNRGMQDSLTIHIPFSELSTAHRFFYWISANVAIGLLRPSPPTMEEIGADIVRIWDEQKFAPADVLDFSLMADRLKPHLAKYAVRDRQTCSSERPIRRRRKN
jgi:hypothetical protein